MGVGVGVVGSVANPISFLFLLQMVAHSVNHFEICSHHITCFQQAACAAHKSATLLSSGPAILTDATALGLELYWWRQITPRLLLSLLGDVSIFLNLDILHSFKVFLKSCTCCTLARDQFLFDISMRIIGRC